MKAVEAIRELVAILVTPGGQVVIMIGMIILGVWVFLHAKESAGAQIVQLFAGALLGRMTVNKNSDS